MAASCHCKESHIRTGGSIDRRFEFTKSSPRLIRTQDKALTVAVMRVCGDGSRKRPGRGWRTFPSVCLGPLKACLMGVEQPKAVLLFGTHGFNIAHVPIL
jgi:hypothetical protein